MKITDLDEAETIVQSNSKLFWAGWDIGCMVEDPAAEFCESGVFDKQQSKWFRLSLFPLERDGWVIPNRVLKT